MKAFIFRAVLFVAFLTCVCSTIRAQYVWQTTLDQSDDTTHNYSPLLLACSGEHCTAIVYAGRLSGDVYEFLRSDDGGLTWHNQWEYPEYGEGYPGYQFVRVMLQIDSLNAVAVGDSGLIIRTFDGGVTWSRQFIPGSFSKTASILSVHFHDSINGIICLGNGPMTTSDGGLHWMVGPYTGISFPTCHCYGAGKFAVFNSNTGVIYSTSNNWATIDSTQPIPNESNLYLALRWSDWTEGDTIIAYGFDSISSGLIMRTTNEGQTWSQSELPLGSGQAIDCMSSISADTLFAGRDVTTPNSILFSSDNGQLWVSDSVPTFTNVGLNGPFFQFGTVNSIVRPAPGVVLAVVQAFGSTIAPGLIIRGTLASSSVSIPAPNSIGIAQVYPNPASDQSIFVNFDYRLAPVRVIDCLGREVLQVAMPSAGMLELDISQLPKGIYYMIDDRERAKFVKE